MRPIAGAVVLVMLAGTAAGYGAGLVQAGDRVAVFRPHTDNSTFRLLQQTMVTELRSRGIEAYDAGCALEQIAGRELPARYWIEVVEIGAHFAMTPARDVVGSPTDAALASRDTATIDVLLRVLDPVTRSELRRYEIHQVRETGGLMIGSAAGPRGAGVARFPIPFRRGANMRSLARDAAHEAALKIAGVNQIE